MTKRIWIAKRLMSMTGYLNILSLVTYVSQNPTAIHIIAILMNRRIHNTPTFVAPKLKGRTRNTNKLMNPIRFTFAASSMIPSAGQLVSRSMASWIIVNSRCVVGLSNGYLLFSARIMYRSMIPNRIIWIKNAEVKYLPIIKSCIDPISQDPVL